MAFAQRAHTPQASVSASAPNTVTPASTPSALLDVSSEPAHQRAGTVPPAPSGDQRVPDIPVAPQRTPVGEIFDQPDGPNPHALADIIIVFGARGGLGKTSLAQAIAGTSAARGRRTVLVDANKGQGDQALLLRLDPTKQVPSAYDAALTGRADDAISSPDLLNKLRGARRDRVDFALVAAPPESIPGAATVTTPRVYRSIIDHSVRIADLVVVDTHPIAPGDPSDMVTDLVLPLLRAGAWGLALTDSSIPGVKHLEGALDYLIEHGVPQDRLMTVINRVPVSANLNMDLLGSRLSRRSHWVGPIFSDDEDVQNRSNAGMVLVDVNTMAHQVENILNRACGLEVVTAPPGERRAGACSVCSDGDADVGDRSKCPAGSSRGGHRPGQGRRHRATKPPAAGEGHRLAHPDSPRRRGSPNAGKTGRAQRRQHRRARAPGGPGVDVAGAEDPGRPQRPREGRRLLRAADPGHLGGRSPAAGEHRSRSAGVTVVGHRDGLGPVRRGRHRPARS